MAMDVPARSLSRLRTPQTPPYTDRRYTHTTGTLEATEAIEENDPRSAFAHDRDRIIHADAFRRLQHKTQVMVVSEGDFFRTRLTHTLEVAQIGRSLAVQLGLSEALAEAICLAHDLGHTPFGHTGESTLNALLAEHGGWDSNQHSLTVVEEIETNYPDHPGLDLTWATREGIARHQTPFDAPVTGGEYLLTPQPGLEAQACNLADVIAYATHDVQDAVESRLLTRGAVQEWAEEIGCGVWLDAAAHAAREVPDLDREALRVRRIRRYMINALILDVRQTTLARAEATHTATLDEARALDAPLIRFSARVEADVLALVGYLLEHVYRGPVISRQAYKARHILDRLFAALVADTRLLPAPWRSHIAAGESPARIAAVYLASLTDRGAIDLYTELLVPGERSLGHHV